MSRFSRVSLLLAAILSLTVSGFAVTGRAEAKGGRSFAAKVGTALVVRSIIKSANKKDRARDSQSEDASDTAEDTATLAAPAQVTAAAEPAVAAPPPPPAAPVGPANSGMVCIAGCYNAQGRSIASN